MEGGTGVDLGTLVGIIAAAVTVMTILARVIEKLLDQQRKKNDVKKCGSATTDLALQATAISALKDDVDETKRTTYDVKGAVTKDIPHLLERIDTGIHSISEFQKEELKELRRVIENNTAATRALQNFLARQGGLGGE